LSHRTAAAARKGRQDDPGGSRGANRGSIVQLGGSLRLPYHALLLPQRLVEGGLAAEEVVVVLGEAVGFVADVLEEAEGVAVAGEPAGFGLAGDVDLFFSLGEADREGALVLLHSERLHGL
jgi:hypothetical protein